MIAADKSDKRSPFKGVPDDIQYKIFAGLDAKGMDCARAVCRKWRAMLSLSELQRKSLSDKSTQTSAGFLVEVVMKNRITHESQEENVRGVSVDGNGDCTRETVFDGVGLSYPLDLTCNGMFFSFSSVYTSRACIVVTHPSLRWRACVPFYETDHNHGLGFHFQFRGAAYEPSTGHFTILVGNAQYGATVGVPASLIRRPRPTPTLAMLPILGMKAVYTIRIYTSVTGKWETLIGEMRTEKYYVFPCGESVYSNGHFLWMDGFYSHSPRAGVLAFRLSDKEFYNIPLPECKLHPNHGGSCIRAGGVYQPNPYAQPWILRGSPGNVLLFHNASVHYADVLVKTSEELRELSFAWRLVVNDETWVWQALPSRMDLRRLLDFMKSSIPNRMGHWLWPFKFVGHRQGQLILNNEDGTLVRLTPLSGIQNIQVPGECYPIVDGLWVLEINNLWQILQSS